MSRIVAKSYGEEEKILHTLSLIAFLARAPAVGWAVEALGLYLNFEGLEFEVGQYT